MMLAQGGLELLFVLGGAFSASAEPILVDFLKLAEVVLIIDVVVLGATGVAGIKIRVAVSISLSFFLLLHHF